MTIAQSFNIENIEEYNLQVVDYKYFTNAIVKLNIDLRFSKIEFKRLLSP